MTGQIGPDGHLVTILCLTILLVNYLVQTENSNWSWLRFSRSTTSDSEVFSPLTSSRSPRRVAERPEGGLDQVEDSDWGRNYTVWRPGKGEKVSYEDLWTSGVHCQVVFKSGPKSCYFQVNKGREGRSVGGEVRGQTPTGEDLTMANAVARLNMLEEAYSGRRRRPA
jgi:hypothetical protein